MYRAETRARIMEWALLALALVLTAAVFGRPILARYGVF
jgi:hypothetical protein